MHRRRLAYVEGVAHARAHDAIAFFERVLGRVWGGGSVTASGPQSAAPAQRLSRRPMAGFQVSTYGRFWVSTEDQGARLAELGPLLARNRPPVVTARA